MRVFGLLGRSLAHSFSKSYFNQKFAQLGLAECRYELFEMADVEELPALLASYPELAGLNVTIPYKEQLWPYLAQVDPSAELVGAVNVIKLRADGGLTGHNTDYVGFRESLRHFYPHRGEAARALVLGTGGAAKAVGVALQELNITYQVVSRQSGTGQLTYEEVTPVLLAENTLIINTTPLGTYPDVDKCPPLPYAALTGQHYLFDLVYNPSETLFLQHGRTAGAQTKNGLEMLELQAEAAWAIWNQ